MLYAESNVKIFSPAGNHCLGCAQFGIIRTALGARRATEYDYSLANVYVRQTSMLIGDSQSHVFGLQDACLYYYATADATVRTLDSASGTTYQRVPVS